MTTIYEHYQEPLARHSAFSGDLYAPTMAAGLFANNMHSIPATFHAYIRKNPFNGGYLLTAGQNIIAEWLHKHWHFDALDLKIMRNATIPDSEGKLQPLFPSGFVNMVSQAKMELTVDAMPEGEIAFPDEPIARIHGPLWQCLMVEAFLLNVINSQSLIATMASRLVRAAGGAPVLEFGMRRAQCIGGLESSRASYVGGVAATSSNEAGKFYGIPTKGTFAHAWVMAHEDELEAFENYARAMPNNGIFLVDTYDTLQGVRNAITACRKVEADLKGIRLDSGDLAYLSIEARKILDEAGFNNAKIAASNDLDEEIISSLKAQGAKIDIWGVGTNLVTSRAQPALGAVFKLAAIFNRDISAENLHEIRNKIAAGHNPNDMSFVRDVIKLSEDAVKVTVPGELDILRYLRLDEKGNPYRFDGDTLISNLAPSSVSQNGTLIRDVISVQKLEGSLRRKFSAGTRVYRPLVRIFENGKLAAPIETIHDARERAARNLALLDDSHRRLLNPHVYGVGLESSLYDKRMRMIAEARKLDI